MKNFMSLMKRIFSLNNLPRITNWLIIIIIIIYNVYEKGWDKDNRIIASDVMGYYLYLPAVVIHKDVTLEFISENPKKFLNKIWFLKSPTGNKVIQFTAGMSILYSPFFLMAHVSAPWFGYIADGYTPPYKIALLISCLFYFGLGLCFLRKILIKYFSAIVTSITLLSLAIGTNLLYYVTYEAPMSHAYSFSLIIIFLYLLIGWLEKPGYGKTILLGLVTGMIVLIRPTNIIVIFLFFLWGIVSWKSFVRRIGFLLRYYKQILLMILAFFIVWIPQFLYWKAISDSYLYFSYGDRAWFFFNDPQVINVLFSYRKGWLLYTPIMVFSLIGIPFLLKKHKRSFLPILIFLLLNIYIISSWWDWWYGGSFGLRAFIDSYGILAIPFASFTDWVISRKLFLKILFLTLFALLLFFNLFQIAQYRHGAIHFASMTKQAYWETFGKKTPTDAFYEKLEYPDYKGIEERIKKLREERNNRKESR